MKTTLKSFFIGILAMAIFSTVSCSKSNNHSAPEVGYLKLADIQAKINVTNVSGKSAAAKGAALVPDPTPTPEEIDLWNVIVKDNAGEKVIEFEDYSQIPAAGIPLSVGMDYTVFVSSENNDVAFQNPYFEGTSDAFSIAAGTTTPVSVTAKVANAKISVDYSTDTTTKYIDYITTVTVKGTDLIFTKDDYNTKSAYFPYQEDAIIEVVLRETGADDVVLTYSIPGISVLTGNAPEYEILVDYDGGGAALTITSDTARTTEGHGIDVNNICIDETDTESLDAADFNLNFKDEATLTGFGSFNVELNQVINPDPSGDVNDSCLVGQFIRTGAHEYDSFSIKFDSKFIFTASDRSFKVKIFSSFDDEDITFAFTLSDKDDPAITGTSRSIIIPGSASGWNEYEIYVPADITNMYNRIDVHFNVREEKSGTYYFDDFRRG